MASNLPETPGEMSIAEFGRAIGWGRGDDAARARADTILLPELYTIGVTLDTALQWRDFYIRELERNPANPSATGRIELMSRIVELLQGGN
jgi:hypothetical protein